MQESEELLEDFMKPSLLHFLTISVIIALIMFSATFIVGCSDIKVG
jgi:hypothetical protein